jgi:hypothetical protein
MKKVIIEIGKDNAEVIDMTSEEISELEINKQDVLLKRQEEETAKQADATNKANGNQKLLDLGLTQAEATALTGYTPPVAE